MDPPAVVPEPEPTAADYQSIAKLVRAVQYGDLKFVETAVEKFHVSVDVRDDDDCTLLHWAAINNRVKIMELLLHHKASVNTMGGENREIPLQWAVRHAHCTAAVHMLITERSDLQHRSIFGYDSLFLAVQAGHLHIVYLLLQAGAKVNTVDPCQDTPLYWLLKYDGERNTLDLQRLLLRFGASVVHRGDQGRVALHYIAEMGNKIDLHSAYLIYMANYTSAATGATSMITGLTAYDTAWRARAAAPLRFFWDAFMYAHLPHALPIAVTALTIFSYFLLLKRYGWLYGVLLWVLVHLSSDVASQKYILRASSRTSCGFAWGVIISSTWAYFKFVSPVLGNVFWDGMVAGTVACIIWTLLRSMQTPAQSLYCDGNDHGDTLVNKILESPPILDTSGRAVGITFRLCPSCLVDKSLTATHCSQCDHCAVGLDHHCPFVNNCVGKGNRRVFVFFTLFAGFGCEMMALLSLYAQYYIMCADAKGMLGGLFAVQGCMIRKEPTLFCATWLALFTGIWISFIFFGQLGMIASETTTFEIIKRANYGLPSMTLRGMQNLGKFLLTGQYYIIDPAFVPTRCCDGAHDHGHRHTPPTETSNSLPTVDSSDESSGSGTSTSRGEHSGQLQKLRTGVADFMLKAQMLNNDGGEV